MSMPSLNEPGKHPGKQIGKLSRSGEHAYPTRRQAVWRSCAIAWSGRPRVIQHPTYAESGRARATSSFPLLPPCFPDFAEWGGEAKNGPKDRLKRLIPLRKSGAGEGIRTLDPNLGKVVLYP